MYGNDPLIGGFWFLNNLFYSIVIVVLLSCFLMRFHVDDKNIAVVVTSLSVLGFILSQFIYNNLNVLFFKYIVGLFCSLACYSLGYYFSVCKIFKKMMVPNIIIMSLSFIILYFSANYLSVKRPFTDVSPIFVPYILVMALIGIYFSYSVAHFCAKMNISVLIEYVGNNTLHILTWHFLSFKFLDLVLVLLHGLPISSMISLYHLPAKMFFEYGWILYAIVGVSLPLIWLNSKNVICSIIKK